MKIYSYHYPEEIRRINEENKFLKSEKKEEKKSLIIHSKYYVLKLKN
mgnify:CR=1 FL=1